MVYQIEHSNLVVSKLWNLAKNGVFDYRTVEGIVKDSDGHYLIFNSKASYDKFKEYEYSNLAIL